MTVTAAGDEMALIHKIFRRAFPMTAELVRNAPEGDTARAETIAAHIDFQLTGLHHHHTGEDVHVWPRLLERAAPKAELVERMEAQHAAVALRTAVVRELLDAWRRTGTGGEALAAALDEFTAALVEHLDEEEARVVPLIRAHITVPEWELLGQETFGKFTNQEKLIATGELEASVTPEEAAAFLGALPAPVRLMWRFVGRRRYRAYMAGVEGRGL